MFLLFVLQILSSFLPLVFFRPMPQCVHFLTCLSETPVPGSYGLLLFCYPSFKQPEVEKKLSIYEIPFRGEGKSKKSPCVGDKIVVSLLGFGFERESQRDKKVVLR